MIAITRRITEEQYKRAMQHNGFIDEHERNAIFSASELYGYGVYSPRVFRNEDNEPCVSFMRGESCD